MAPVTISSSIIEVPGKFPGARTVSILRESHVGCYKNLKTNCETISQFPAWCWALEGALLIALKSYLIEITSKFKI